MKDEAWPAVFEPRMVTAVHLDEEAGLGHAVAAAAMTGWPSFAGTAEARRPQPALDGGPGHAELLALGDELGEVAVVAACVGGAGEGQQALARGVGDAAWRRSAAVAMRERREATLPDRGHEAAEVPNRET